MNNTNKKLELVKRQYDLCRNAMRVNGRPDRWLQKRHDKLELKIERLEAELIMKNNKG